MTYGEFKQAVHNTFDSENGEIHFSLGGIQLLRMNSWSDDEINALEMSGYEEEYNETEDGRPERWFFVTAKGA